METVDEASPILLPAPRENGLKSIDHLALSFIRNWRSLGVSVSLLFSPTVFSTLAIKQTGLMFDV